MAVRQGGVGSIMKRVMRGLGIGAAVLLSLVVLAGAGVFIASEFIFGRGHAAQPERLAEPTAAQLADASRQARILGCVSCHGEGLRGRLMTEVPNVIRVQAPNIPAIAARATDQQLAAAIRQGIGHDRRPLFVMPSPMYSRLSDGEVAALIRWIRTLPRASGGIEGVTMGPLGRVALVTGKLRPVPAMLPEFRTQAPIDLGAAHATGRQLAAAACSGCHGPALFGGTMEEGTVTPDLAVARGYDYEQFKHLLRTGTTPAGKKLGLMRKVAEDDFSNYTDAELKALYDYLDARAGRLES